MSYQVEHTDTFGGEANYAWVLRFEIPSRPEPSRGSLVRRVKRLCGLTNVRCDVEDYGGDLTIRPRGICQVVFVTWQDETGAQS